jgi:hypothetical protein
MGLAGYRDPQDDAREAAVAWFGSARAWTLGRPPARLRSYVADPRIGALARRRMRILLVCALVATATILASNTIVVVSRGDVWWDVAAEPGVEIDRDSYVGRRDRLLGFNFHLDGFRLFGSFPVDARKHYDVQEREVTVTLEGWDPFGACTWGALPLSMVLGALGLRSRFSRLEGGCEGACALVAQFVPWALVCLVLFLVSAVFVIVADLSDPRAATLAGVVSVGAASLYTFAGGVVGWRGVGIARSSPGILPRLAGLLAVVVAGALPWVLIAALGFTTMMATP